MGEFFLGEEGKVAVDGRERKRESEEREEERKEELTVSGPGGNRSQFCCIVIGCALCVKPISSKVACFRKFVNEYRASTDHPIIKRR